MKEDPDIVKILREEEKKGKLQYISASDNVLQSQSSSSQVQETMMIPKDNLDKKEKIELEQLDDKYKIIFENYAVAITIVDEKERIFSWNKYAEDLFNMSEEELYLKPIDTLYPPEEWKLSPPPQGRKKTDLNSVSFSCRLFLHHIRQEAEGVNGYGYTVSCLSSY